MEKFEEQFLALFQLLWVFAAIDGDVDASELDTIEDIAKKITGAPDVQRDMLRKILKDIESYSLDEKAQFLVRAGKIIDSESDKHYKMKILDMIMQVIHADGDMTDYELQAFYALTKCWNIDSKEYLEHFKNS